MEITLDQETWDVAEHVPLSEVLADIGNKARVSKRIVASLSVGGRPLSDRDLQPAFLAKAIAAVGPVKATTRSLAETLLCARDVARQFAGELETEALQLLARFRVGDTEFGAFDRWLGGLADYVEYHEHLRAQVNTGTTLDSIASSITELLEARRREDVVCLADVLEYELLPKLER